VLDTNISAERDIPDQALAPVFVETSVIGIVNVGIALPLSDLPPVNVGEDTTSGRLRGW
jgi:hypothetical protein